MNNSSLSLRRIMQVLAYDWQTNRKSYIRTYCLTGIVCLILLLLCMPICYVENLPWLASYRQCGGKALIIVFIVMYYYFATTMSTVLSTEAKRLNYRMLPASVAEKFAARYLATAVLPFFVLLAVMFAASLLSLFLLPLHKVPLGEALSLSGFAFIEVIKGLHHMLFESGFVGAAVVCSILFCLQSACVYCGCRWSRLALLRVLALLGVANILLSFMSTIAIAIIAADHFDMLWLHRINAAFKWLAKCPEEVICAFLIGLSAALSILLLWRGYRRFRRAMHQIV